MVHEREHGISERVRAKDLVSSSFEHQFSGRDQQRYIAIDQNRAVHGGPLGGAGLRNHGGK